MPLPVYRKIKGSATASGVDGFIADVSRYVATAVPGWQGTVRFMLQIGEAYAYIRLPDVVNPLRFLTQLEGAPPVRFGTEGIRKRLVVEGGANPAPHYVAFLFVGFWLPAFLAVLVLYAWEVLGYLRYHFHWSPEDIRSGFIGIRHGRLVRRYGPTVLPALIASDLAD